MLTTARLRAEMRRYHRDLLRRVRLVPCRHCGAKAEQWCIGVQTGLPRACCCGTRHYDAKLAGHVSGLSIRARAMKRS